MGRFYSEHVHKLLSAMFPTVVRIHRTRNSARRAARTRSVTARCWPQEARARGRAAVVEMLRYQDWPGPAVQRLPDK